MLVCVLGAVLVPSPARAAVTCTFNATTHVVSIVGDADVTVTRAGDELVVQGAPCLDGSTAATVTNTDLIKVDVSIASRRFILNLSNGPMAPGFTNEPGNSDEIEISTVRGVLTFTGTPGPDHFVGGRDGINLNASESSFDVDITGVFFFLGWNAGDGDDVLSLRGGSGTGPAVAVQGSNFAGGLGNDILLMTPVPKNPPSGIFDYILDGGAGNDRIEGGPGDEEISGQSDVDILIGGGGPDELDGGTEIDTVSFSSATAPVQVDLSLDTAPDGATVPNIENVNGSSFADSILGDVGTNVLRGGGGDDTIDGLDGADQLFGEAGNDRLVAQAMGETVNGGSGSDTADYVAPIMNTIDLPAGTAIGSGGSDTLTSIENVDSAGSVSVVGTSGPNVITIVDGPASVFAGGGNDELLGGAGDETLRGEGGNDVLTPFTGGGTMIGGSGNDRFEPFNEAGYELLGGTGRDLVDFTKVTTSGVTLDLTVTAPQNAGTGDITVTELEDVIGTLQRADTITGTGSANRLTGQGGDDVLIGAGGNDTLIGSQGEDDLAGGPGIDTVSFAGWGTGVRVDLAISGLQDTNVGYDTITQVENILGSSFADALFGNGGPNKLTGGSGNDQLVGRGGNDVLDGGPGTDSCNGGPGTNKLVSC